MENKYTVEEVKQSLASEWGVELKDVPSASTLNRKLKAWEFRPCDQPADVQKEVLRARMEVTTSVYNDLALVDEIQNLRSQGHQSCDMLDRLHSSGWPDLSLKQLKKLRHCEGVYLRTQLGKVEESYEQVCQSSMAPFLQYFELNCIGADLTRDRG